MPQAKSHEEVLKQTLLSAIEVILAGSETSLDSLYKLLKIVPENEDLTIDETKGDRKKREKAINQLKKFVHPDKHTQDIATRANEATQNVDIFTAACLAGPPVPTKKRTSIVTLARHPDQHRALEEQVCDWDKWVKDDDLVVSMTRGCLNLRGAVVCPYEIENYYTAKDVPKKNSDSETIKAAWSVVKQLKTENDIKDEILNNGQVVSWSFAADLAFYETAAPDIAQDNKMHPGQSYPVFIVGWKRHRSGFEWEVADYRGRHFQVSFGHFRIEDDVSAPGIDVKKVLWLAGPSLLVDEDYTEWKTWSKYKVLQKCEAICSLLHELGGDIAEIVKDEKPRVFTLAHETFKYQARRATLQNVKACENGGMEIKGKFVEAA